jgi:HIV Tat-specific factor 1
MATRIPFPQQESDFGSDTRISYSKVDEKFILEEEDGSEWEFDASLGKWMPSVSYSYSLPPSSSHILSIQPCAELITLLRLQVDEGLLQQQQQAYAVPGVDENESAEAALKKRKQADRDAEEVPVRISQVLASGWKDAALNICLI